MIPWSDLNRRHITTDQCAKVTEIKFRQMEEEKLRENAERAFQDYRRPFTTVTSLKYLGQALTAAYDDWPEVVGNLRKIWKSWAHLARLLGQEGAKPRVSGIFFQGGGTGGATIWVRDVGSYLLHRTGPGKLSTRGSKADNGDTSKEIV